MSLAFLSPTAVDAVARSPMERLARGAGARFEVRDGWNVAVEYGSEPGPVAWADVSHLRKWEIRGGAVSGARVSGELGWASREGKAWWCGVTPDRVLVVGGSAAPAGALDVTCNQAALTILGPNAREAIARFCAIDLRPQVSPPHSFRPGSIARQPGMIVVEAENRYLLLFGWALGEYMWRVVEDAARHLGGGPVGIDALSPVSEVAARA